MRDIRIIQAVSDIFDELGDRIRYDIEHLENVLNDEIPDLIDERYLFVQGVKEGIYEKMLVDQNRDIQKYVPYVQEKLSIDEGDALFITHVFDQVIDDVVYFFMIPNLEALVDYAYKENNLERLKFLAKIFFSGYGIYQDYERAFQMYSYLFEHGDESGVYYLGYMYEHGYGVEKDDQKALMYYRRGKDDLCYCQMGMHYMQGKIVEQDDDKALDYFVLSHHKDAYLYRGMILEGRRDYSGAFEAYFKGASMYQRECTYKVAQCFQKGLGVELNLDEAKHYFEYGYYLLHGDCTYELSMMYMDGIAYPKDQKKAIYYLHQAADMYSREACLALAKFYEIGQYVKKDSRKSQMYYQKASHIYDLIENMKGELNEII